jgi:uncharacterized protein (TIGR02588 family)
VAARKGNDKPPVKGAPTTSVSEWIVASVSAAMVLGMLAFLVYDGLRSPRTPAAITVETDSIQAAGPGYLVLFRARNGGRTTAAHVVVEGVLETGSGQVETSETTLDYVPAEGEQRGGLYFRQDPRRYTLRLRSHGFREP